MWLLPFGSMWIPLGLLCSSTIRVQAYHRHIGIWLPTAPGASSILGGSLVVPCFLSLSISFCRLLSITSPTLPGLYTRRGCDSLGGAFLSLSLSLSAPLSHLPPCFSDHTWPSCLCLCIFSLQRHRQGRAPFPWIKKERERGSVHLPTWW